MSLKGGIKFYSVTVSPNTHIQRTLIFRNQEAIISWSTWTNSNENWKKLKFMTLLPSQILNLIQIFWCSVWSFQIAVLPLICGTPACENSCIIFSLLRAWLSPLWHGDYKFITESLRYKVWNMGICQTECLTKRCCWLHYGKGRILDLDLHPF